MSEHEALRLPEGFAEFLEDNDIPCPPVPLSALDALDRTDDNFFATDQRPVPFVPVLPEDMDAVLDAWSTLPETARSGASDNASASGEEEDAGAGVKADDAEDASASAPSPDGEVPFYECGYAGFGLAGGGLQGMRVLFLLKEGPLRFGVSLPWNRAFGDPAQEREELEAAFRLAEVCLCRRPGDGVLRVFVNDLGCRWSFTGQGAESGGDDVDGLLDRLEVGEMVCGEDVPFSMWMRV